MVNVKKWTLFLILFSAFTVTLVSYVLLSEPYSFLEEEKRCLNYVFSLMNTTQFSEKRVPATTKLNSSITAHMSPQLQFTSWTKGVLTQIHPGMKRNCTKLMAGDKTEAARVAEAMSSWNAGGNCAGFLTDMPGCHEMWEEFHNSMYVSAEEKNFPIAYILVVYTNAEQLVRFLKAIYRPQNIYCIHPDLKSGEGFISVFQLLSKCLHNVFVASNIQKVQYGRNVIFEAQMSCYQDLNRYPANKWYYVINLCGRELPLKTNYEIVKSLKTMNGTSLMRPTPVDEHTVHERFYRKPKIEGKTVGTPNSSDLVGPPPFDIRLYKSSSYNALSHVFVHYFLHNETVQTFMQWIKYAWVPEEHFYASVYMMPGSPGGQSSLHPIQSQALVSKAIWKHNHHSPYYRPSETCAGKTVHEICILNSAELPRVNEALKRNVWFFNKYFMEDDHVIMDCVEEVLVKKNMDEFYSNNNVSLSE